LDQESDELVRYVTNLEEVNQELVLNLLKRIATLEEINSQLATDLKSCVGLLKVFKEAVPNPEEWQDMLDTLESNLHAVETVQDEKMFNQLVGGSNPLRPTRKIKHLWHFSFECFFG